MDYQYKYIKYKKKYLKLNNIKSKYLMRQKNITGGNITWATEEYIKSIISSKNPDLSRCDLIKDIKPKKNEGRNNNGIGFVNIEGKEYFLKYGDNLLDEFKTGYQLSKLRSEYPYFLNVHSLFECNYVSKIGEPKNGQVLVVDKGTETIYNYLNRKSKEYILNLIPDLEVRVNELDEKITKIINTNLTDEEKTFYDSKLEEKDKIKYDFILSEINELVKEFYLSLSREIIQFQSEFIPLFLQNYKALIDSYMIVDIFTLNKYNNYIGDVKSDNFMIITEPYVENKTHVNIKLGLKDIRINNVCEWHNTKEYCFLYPVDFGSGGNMDYPKLNDDLLPYFLNQYISHYSRLSLGSDVRNINLESGNILSLKSIITFKFSKFSSDNNITKLNLETIFKKYNLFKIKIFNPLQCYVKGMESMIDNTINRIELDRLLTESQLKKNDFRFHSFSKKLLNINTLEEACEILQILLNGNTVIYDDIQNNYKSYSNCIDFITANGLSKNINFLDDQNVYKTFTIPLNYKINLKNKKLFLEYTATDAKYAMKKFLDNIIHISHDTFIQQIKNNLEKNIIIANKLEDRPLFFYINSYGKKDKSNYWVYNYIKQFLNEKNIETVLLSENNNDYKELIDNDIVLLADDCVYSGDQMMKTMSALYTQLDNEKNIQLLLFVPYMSLEGKNNIVDKFIYNQKFFPKKLKLSISEYIEILPLNKYLNSEEAKSIFKYYTIHTELNKYIIYFDHKVADYISSYPYIFNGLVPNEKNKTIMNKIFELKKTFFKYDYSNLEKLKKEYDVTKDPNIEKILIEENEILEKEYYDFDNTKNIKIEELQNKLDIFPLLTNCDHIKKSIDFEKSVCPIPPYKKEYSDFLNKMYEAYKTKNIL
jgi:hypothetical protein